MTKTIQFFILGTALLMLGPHAGWALQLTSPIIKHFEWIPDEYTCDGFDFSPPLEVVDIPEGTKSLTLVVDDPDAPSNIWVHWVVFNIEPTKIIVENSIPGTQGMNDFQRLNYGGPCPPSGTHRYFFKLYALDTMLDLPEGATKTQVESAMEGHILEETQLVGLYKR